MISKSILGSFAHFVADGAQLEKTILISEVLGFGDRGSPFLLSLFANLLEIVMCSRDCFNELLDFSLRAGSLFESLFIDVTDFA